MQNLGAPIGSEAQTACLFCLGVWGRDLSTKQQADRELPHVLIHEACAHPSTLFRIPNSTPPRTGHPQPDPSDYDPHQIEDATLPVPTPEHTLNNRQWTPPTFIADRPETHRSTLADTDADAGR